MEGAQSGLNEGGGGDFETQRLGEEVHNPVLEESAESMRKLLGIMNSSTIKVRAPVTGFNEGAPS